MGLDLKVVRHTDPELARLYEAPLVLIRPDQIVAWRGQDGHASTVVMARATGLGATIPA